MDAASARGYVFSVKMKSDTFVLVSPKNCFGHHSINFQTMNETICSIYTFIPSFHNLQLKSCILTVATAGVTFTDPGGKVGSSRRDKFNCSSSTPSGTSSTNIGNVKVCDRCVALKFSSRTRNSRMLNGIS